jgi:predicted MFS family arabinose efflux permease
MRALVLTRYVVTAVFARLADEGARVGILLLALERTGRPALGGLLVAALMVPHVLAAPVVGTVADTVRHRRLFYGGVFAGYAALLLAATALIGRSAPAAAVLLAAAGCCAPILIGGLSSLLGELAGDRLDRAFGLDVTSYGVGGIAGPAVAAGVAAVAGAFWSLVALATLVLAGGVLVVTLPLRGRPPGEAPPARPHPLGAVRLMWRDPELGAVTAASVLSTTGMGALALVAALLAEAAHSTAYAGVVLAAGAAGGVAGSLLCTVFPLRRHRPAAVVLLCVAVSTLAFVLLAAVPAAWRLPALALFAVAGACQGPMSVAVFAVRDRAATPDLRTQVFTVGAGLKVSGAALGSAVAGLAAGAGPAAILLGVAGCQALAGLAVVARVTLARRGRKAIVS